MAGLVDFGTVVDGVLQKVFADKDGVTLKPAGLAEADTTAIFLNEEVTEIVGNTEVQGNRPTLTGRLVDWPFAPYQGLLVLVKEDATEYVVDRVVDIEAGTFRLELKVA